MADDRIKVSGMTEATDTQMTDDAIIQVAVTEQSASTGFLTRKSTLARLANYILNKHNLVNLAGLTQTVKSAFQSVLDKINEIVEAIGDEPMGTTATTVTGAIAEHESDISELNSKTTYLLLAATSASTTISANTSAVVNFSFSVPTGYRIVAAWDDSYLANVIAAPIRINQSSGTVSVTFNYYALAAMTRAFSIKALALMME